MVIGIVVVAIMAMRPMIMRASQGMIRTVADQIGNQANSDQKVDNMKGGFLDRSNSRVTLNTNKQTLENAGRTKYQFNDEISTDSMAFMNLGYTEDK